MCFGSLECLLRLLREDVFGGLKVWEGVGFALLSKYLRRTEASAINDISRTHPVLEYCPEPVGRRNAPGVHKGFCKNQLLPGGALVVPTLVYRPATTVFAARAICNSGNIVGPRKLGRPRKILALAVPARSSHGFAYGPNTAQQQSGPSSFLLEGPRCWAIVWATGQAP